MIRIYVAYYSIETFLWAFHLARKIFNYRSYAYSHQQSLAAPLFMHLLSKYRSYQKIAISDINLIKCIILGFKKKYLPVINHK